MEFICCYFDTQGFYINETYHPIEVAMSGDNFLWHTRVAKKCGCQPSGSEKSQMRYLTENHHGLRAESEGSMLCEVKELVKGMYESNRTEKKFLVACRSRESEFMLKRFNIPFININDKYGATFAKIKKGRKPCILHGYKMDESIKCSLNLIQDMEQFVKPKLGF